MLCREVVFIGDTFVSTLGTKRPRVAPTFSDPPTPAVLGAAI